MSLTHVETILSIYFIHILFYIFISISTFLGPLPLHLIFLLNHGVTGHILFRHIQY